jgi:23S rRNA pseudouridine955/2504/2580 synthase
MKEVTHLVVTPENGEVRLDRFLRRRFPHLSQSQIERLIRTGQVRVNGARAKANDRLVSGAAIRVPPLPDEAPRLERAAISEADMDYIQRFVIHRDDDVIVLNKPSGLATQGGAKVARSVDSLLPGLMFGADAKPKLVHRLDKDTSGCLVLARHPAAAASLSAAFKGRETLKVYWAVVLGAPRPQSGEIRGWLKKATGPKDSDREMVRRAAHGDEEALFAITQYEVLSEAAQRLSWVALRPVTGRTHQLRFHMAEAGHAMLADRKYVCDRPTPGALSERLHLHARAIEAPHPSGKGVLKVIAPLPEHFKKTFNTLGFEEGWAKDPFKPFR